MTHHSKRKAMTLDGYRVGVAGLGLMGRPMALNLLAAGAELKVWNRTLRVAQALQCPVLHVCQDLAELAQGSEIVVLLN